MALRRAMSLRQGGVSLSRRAGSSWTILYCLCDRHSVAVSGYYSTPESVAPTFEQLTASRCFRSRRHLIARLAQSSMVTNDLQSLSLDDSQQSPDPVQANNSDTFSKKAAAPYFFPPLWLARRTACISALRAEGIRSVSRFSAAPV